MVIPEEGGNTGEVIEVTKEQLKAYRELNEPDLKRDFIERLNQVQIYKTLDASQREKMRALFNEHQIREVVQIDVEYGYNFQDPQMADCFEALNALPRRTIRKIVQRIMNRKVLAATLNTEGTTKLEKALQKKYTKT